MTKNEYMEELDFNKIVISQFRIDDKKVPSLMKNVVKIVGTQSLTSGYIFQDFPVKNTSIKNDKKDIWLCGEQGCQLFCNPNKKEELSYVMGIDEEWYGIYKNYLILNYGDSGINATIFELKN